MSKMNISSKTFFRDLFAALMFGAVLVMLAVVFPMGELHITTITILSGMGIFSVGFHSVTSEPHTPTKC